MSKQILQIENTNNKDFRNEILSGVRNILSELQKNVEPDEILLTRNATAEMLSISLVTLWKLTSKNVIPAFRIGTRVRYKKSDVLKALTKMNDFDNKKNKGYEY
jgi:excisionase family DNA binding protein